MKKTLVLGASARPNRTSNIAVERLLVAGHPVIPVARIGGEIDGIPIQTDRPFHDDIHTITLYLRPETQKEFYDYILKLKPERLIFNPGTENSELMQLAKENGIHTETACTLVMLAMGSY